MGDNGLFCAPEVRPVVRDVDVFDGVTVVLAQDPQKLVGLDLQLALPSDGTTDNDRVCVRARERENQMMMKRVNQMTNDRARARARASSLVARPPGERILEGKSLERANAKTLLSCLSWSAKAKYSTERYT